MSNVSGYVTGEYIPSEMPLGETGSGPSLASAESGLPGANAIEGDKIVRVCCRLGRYTVYGKDTSVKNWKSVYLKIKHPTTVDATVNFTVEAVEQGGANTSEETYIMLYGPAPGGGLVDYRNVPVLPIYE